MKAIEPTPGKTFAIVRKDGTRLQGSLGILGQGHWDEHELQLMCQWGVCRIGWADVREINCMP